MTATTPVYALPYPETTDPPDGPSQMSALALAVETELAKLNGTGAAAWTAFTPTWTNITIGNGTSECAYIKRGRLVVARFKLTFGSTTVITSTPQPGLPVTAAAAASLAQADLAVYRDVSASSNFFGIIHMASTTVVQFSQLGRASATDAFASISATVPFTWATGDIMGGTVTYEAAA